MDDYAALHRHRGLPRGPVDDELLNAAVAAKLRETDDLDWKQELPPMKGLGKTDFRKDVAAFANAGGGTIVYGVTEVDMAAEDRINAGDCTEADVRTMATVAASHIHPPVLGLRVHRLDTTDKHAVIVVVPQSLDRPHMILCDHQRFGAPLRNGADTHWMSEREIAERYRQRFAEQRNAAEALDRLFDGAQVDMAASQRAWAFTAARPRLPIARPAGLLKDEVQAMINNAKASTQSMLWRPAAQPLNGVDYLNLRPGLRRWTARPRLVQDPSLHAWTSVHQDGSVTLSSALRGNPNPSGNFVQLERAQVPTFLIETFAANLVAMIGQVGPLVGAIEYEVRIGLAWPQNYPLTFLPMREDADLDDFENVPRIRRFEPVEALITLETGPDDVLQQVRDLATDCVNQGGADELVVLRTAR
jgi:hypothetical protein